MNQKQQLENDIKELETKLNEMKATVAAMPPEAPARWVPMYNENYWFLNYGNGTACKSCWVDWQCDKYRLSQRNVFKTEEDAETYRLRLESFVPALGLETPSAEVLKSGWLVEFDGTAEPVNDDCEGAIVQSYQDGTWQPTKEAAEAWLAKYGKVRGYAK